MTIANIKANLVVPFDIEDEKLKKMFSFFLHTAPTIDSKSAAKLNLQRLSRNWLDIKAAFPNNEIVFFSHSYSNDKFVNCFSKFRIDDNSLVNRKTKAIVCKKKDSTESEYQCILRHLRNSIAHDNVFLSNAGNRKYLLFEDFNKKNNITARILLSQADLAVIKREIMK